MQTHYIELIAIPQSDISQVELISFCMQKLHQILPRFKGRIGIAFPMYSAENIGGVLRLFGNEDDCLRLQTYLLILQDYMLIKNVMPTPKNITYRCYSRVHHKGQSALRRAERRLSSQQKWNETTKLAMLEKMQQQNFYPHFHLSSSSTGQKFLLAIKMQPKFRPRSGEFNFYGLSLSDQATVPHF